MSDSTTTSSTQTINTIYCFAPSGRISDVSLAQKGVSFLEKQGFKVFNTGIFSRSDERFAGNDEERAEEINSLYDRVQSQGPMIALATRGGFGVNRMMHLIDWARLGQAVQMGLKLVGHSDITAIQLGLLAKTGQPSYAGPMLCYDFGQHAVGNNDFTFEHFYQATILQKQDITVAQPQRFVQEPLTISSAKIWGGNLSLVQSLVGTPYFPNNVAEGILFLEDVNEHPYRIERMLWQLLENGILETQQAVLFGEFSEFRLTQLDQNYNLFSALGRIHKELQSRGHKTQFLHHLPFGHIPNKVTIKVGAHVNLSLSPQGFSLTKAD